MGAFEDAIAHYRRALEIEPELAEAHLNIGRAWMMMGQQDEAVAALAAEIEVAPDSSLAHFLLGQAYVQRQDYEKAKDCYERAVAIQPDYANAYYGLTTVCARLGQRERAQAYAAQFKQLKADERERLKTSKRKYDDLATMRKNAAVTFIRAGQLYRRQDRQAQAEACLQRGTALDPENVVSFLELASLYQQSSQPARALTMFKQVVAAQPDSAIGHLMVGVLSVQLRQLDGAEAAFKTAMRLAPRKSDAYRELARLYLRKGEKFAEAKQLAAQALSLEKSAANYFVWGWACDKTGDTTNALPAVRRAGARPRQRAIPAVLPTDAAKELTGWAVRADRGSGGLSACWCGASSAPRLVPLSP
ncbi:MAG: tetratricopeptide repeat protein [Sedimentisphaerales bacterium]|nr:tetratricopeptide repeat protein [Sedimentisphaerales bacterium]